MSENRKNLNNKKRTEEEKEKIRKWRRQYYHENIERMREKNRIYAQKRRKRKKEETREYMKDYMKKYRKRQVFLNRLKAIDEARMAGKPIPKWKNSKGYKLTQEDIDYIKERTRERRVKRG